MNRITIVYGLKSQIDALPFSKVVSELGACVMVMTNDLSHKLIKRILEGSYGTDLYTHTLILSHDNTVSARELLDLGRTFPGQLTFRSATNWRQEARLTATQGPLHTKEALKAWIDEVNQFCDEEWQRFSLLAPQLNSHSRFEVSPKSQDLTQHPVGHSDTQMLKLMQSRQTFYGMDLAAVGSADQSVTVNWPPKARQFGTSQLLAAEQKRLTGRDVNIAIQMADGTEFTVNEFADDVAFEVSSKMSDWSQPAEVSIGFECHFERDSKESIGFQSMFHSRYAIDRDKLMETIKEFNEPKLTGEQFDACFVAIKQGFAHTVGVAMADRLFPDVKMVGHDDIIDK